MCQSAPKPWVTSQADTPKPALKKLSACSAPRGLGRKLGRKLGHVWDICLSMVCVVCASVHMSFYVYCERVFEAAWSARKTKTFRWGLADWCNNVPLPWGALGGRQQKNEVAITAVVLPAGLAVTCRVHMACGVPVVFVCPFPASKGRA
eukprot:EG_transcript_30434